MRKSRLLSRSRASDPSGAGQRSRDALQARVSLQQTLIQQVEDTDGAGFQTGRGSLET